MGPADGPFDLRALRRRLQYDPGERYGTLRRIRNRYNGDVNGYFLCDRGRYGYEFVNSPRRVRHPLARDGDGQLVPVSKEAVLAQIGRLLHDSERVIGIGSARASLESNFALRRLVGPENFYLGTCSAEAQLLSAAIDILRRGPVPSASASEVGSCGCRSSAGGRCPQRGAGAGIVPATIHAA